MTDFSSYDDLLTLHLHGDVSLQRHAEGQQQTAYSSSGGLCLDPKQVTRRYIWDGEAPTVLNLYLSPSLLHQTITHVSAIDPTRVELIGAFHFADPLISQLMLAMLAEVETDGLYGQPYMEALSTTLVLHLLRHYASIPLHPSSLAGRLSGQQIHRVRDYIDEHLTQGVSLAGMAAFLDLSPSYFSRLFKEATGLSPYQYVIQCRLDRATQFLQDPHLTFSLAEVAHHVGFTDQSHLHRHLKRHLGITPADLRSKSTEE